MGKTDEQEVVLVVDDEKAVADVYAKHLSERYDVRTAYSGDGALETMSPAIDVVLLDRRMPDRSGSEVLDRIRSDGYDCRIVFITAIEPNLDILSLEFDEYLTKPVFADDLYDVVEAMLARNEYVETVQESIALVSKMATLEAKMDIDELEASEEYAAVQRRFQELREDVRSPPSEGIYTDLAQQKLQVLFE